MLGYTSYPSNFQQYYPQPFDSYSHHPHQSCSHQARYPYSYESAMDDEPSYYAYLDHLRARQEQRELEEAIVRRRAREQAFFAVQQAEARARARAYEEAQQAAHRRKVLLLQRQAEQQALAIAKARAVEAERQRRIEAAQAKRVQEAQARAFVHAVLRAIASQAATEPSHSSKSVAAAPQPAITAAHSSPVQAVEPTPKPVSAAQPKASTPPKVFVQKAYYYVHSGNEQGRSAKEHLSAISKLKQRFEESRKAFVQPEALTFDKVKSTPASPVLAFTPENKAYRVYEESLTRLLVDLDQIATEGSSDVRAQRKALAVAIEEELTRLDNMKAQAWEKERKRTDAESVSVGHANVAETEGTPSNSTEVSEGTAIVQNNVEPPEEAVPQPETSDVSAVPAHPTEAATTEDNADVESKETEIATSTDVQEESASVTTDLADKAHNGAVTEAVSTPTSPIDNAASVKNTEGYLVDQSTSGQAVDKTEELSTEETASTQDVQSPPEADREDALSSAEQSTPQLDNTDKTTAVEAGQAHDSTSSVDAAKDSLTHSPALSSVDKSTKVSDEEDDDDDSSDSSFEMLDL